MMKNVLLLILLKMFLLSTQSLSGQESKSIQHRIGVHGGVIRFATLDYLQSRVPYTSNNTFINLTYELETNRFTHLFSYYNKTDNRVELKQKLNNSFSGENRINAQFGSFRYAMYYQMKNMPNWAIGFGLNSVGSKRYLDVNTNNLIGLGRKSYDTSLPLIDLGAKYSPSITKGRLQLFLQATILGRNTNVKSQNLRSRNESVTQWNTFPKLLGSDFRAIYDFPILKWLDGVLQYNLIAYRFTNVNQTSVLTQFITLGIQTNFGK